MIIADKLLRFGCVLAIAVPIAVGSGEAAAAAEATPQDLVESFHHVLLDTMMNAGALGAKGRIAALEPVISRSFDMTHIVRMVVGSEWDKLSADQQARLSVAFERFEVAQFADLFDSYQGQRFRTLAIKPTGEGFVVATVMEGSDRPVIHFDYTVHRVGDDWRIEDIRFDSWLSVVERRSAELRDVLQRRGFDGLMSRLAKHTQAVLDGGGKASHLASLRPDTLSAYVVPLPLP